jgi:hypothetical protein
VDRGSNASNQLVSYEEVIDLRIFTSCDERCTLAMGEIDKFIEMGLMDFDTRFFKDEILICGTKVIDDGIE